MLPSAMLARIVTDGDWRIPAVRVAEARARGGGRPAYVYQSVIGGFPHIAFDGGPAQGATRALLEAYAPAWANFASTGDPNHAALPAWVPYAPDDATRPRATMMFGYEPALVTDPWPRERAAWDGVR